MKYLDRTLFPPAHDLALDEALLEGAEAAPGAAVLRFAEPPRPVVVVGFGNRLATEVNLDACAAAGVPVRRRLSGGGAVVLGPGCLAYSLALPLDGRPELETVTGTNRFIMERHRAALAGLLPGRVTVEGHTDLAWNGRKFSGNAQRRRRAALLFHGTFLFRFDLALLDRFLRHPSTEPGWRKGRRHADFAVNVAVASADVKAALAAAWGADEPMSDPPLARAAALACERYDDPAWTERLR